MNQTTKHLAFLLPHHTHPPLMTEFGFDQTYASVGMWGSATYFAVNAAYSYGYSYKLDQQQRQMFFADVIVGTPTPMIKSDRTLRRPPVNEHPPKPDPYGNPVQYDCVCGYTNGSDVFMSYAPRCRAYPTYLLTYTKS